jgi:hypothetical protein
VRKRQSVLRDLHFDGHASVSTPFFDSRLTLIELERQHIERVLNEEGGRVEKAAKRLGIPAVPSIKRSRNIKSKRLKSRQRSEYQTSAKPLGSLAWPYSLTSRNIFDFWFDPKYGSCFAVGFSSASVHVKLPIAMGKLPWRGLELLHLPCKGSHRIPDPRQ